jgi:hypothetical protein
MRCAFKHPGKSAPTGQKIGGHGQGWHLALQGQDNFLKVISKQACVLCPHKKGQERQERGPNVISQSHSLQLSLWWGYNPCRNSLTTTSGSTSPYEGVLMWILVEFLKRFLFERTLFQVPSSHFLCRSVTRHKGAYYVAMFFMKWLGYTNALVAK